MVRRVRPSAVSGRRTETAAQSGLFESAAGSIETVAEQAERLSDRVIAASALPSIREKVIDYRLPLTGANHR